jgi:hypothetical protein
VTSEPEDYGVVFLEVGMKGELTSARAARGATAILGIAATAPEATITVMIGGFDNDPRELWDIAEAATYVRMLAFMICAHGHHLDDFKFHDDTLAMFALCCGVGKITAHHGTSYTVEINPP